MICEIVLKWNKGTYSESKVNLSNIGSNPIFFAMIEKFAKWLGKRHNVPCNYRVCGVMVAHGIWDAGAAFESHIFYLRASETEYHAWLITKK